MGCLFVTSFVWSNFLSSFLGGRFSHKYSLKHSKCTESLTDIQAPAKKKKKWWIIIFHSHKTSDFFSSVDDIINCVSVKSTTFKLIGKKYSIVM